VDEEEHTAAAAAMPPWMEQMIKAKMGEEYAKPPQVIDSFDVEGIAKHIAGGAKNIIVMAGAGVSVSAGIPDFRTPGTGLYSQLKRYNLPQPEAIFSIDFFKENPAPFYTLAKELYPGLHCPTPGHYFFKLLQDKGLLLRVFTQNIDSLESIAGVDPSLVVAAHGNFDSAHCIETGKEVDVAEVREAILAGEAGWKAMSEKHGGLVKPDIVFFGENLPARFFEHVKTDFPKCDLLIVMGTSLKVQPFASLVDNVAKETPRLLINREEVGTHTAQERTMLRMLERSEGFVFGDGERWRDVALLGDCDDGVHAVAAALGWSDDLEALIVAGQNQFDASKKGSKGGAAGVGGVGGEDGGIAELAKAVDGVNISSADTGGAD